MKTCLQSEIMKNAQGGVSYTIITSNNANVNNILGINLTHLMDAGSEVIEEDKEILKWLKVGWKD